MTIEQANQYFAALPDGFASTEQLRTAFTAPVQKVQFVGVAGTAGKTVVARLLAAILHAQGIHAGLYHAGSRPLSERICIDDAPVDEGLLALTAEALSTAEALPRDAAELAAAANCFGAAGCTLAVVELPDAGLAEALPGMPVCAVTSVGPDGVSRSVERLAALAAGFMRKGSICVTAPEQPKAVLSELIVAAGKCGCELVVPDPEDITFLEAEKFASKVDYGGYTVPLAFLAVTRQATPLWLWSFRWHSAARTSTLQMKPFWRVWRRWKTAAASGWSRSARWSFWTPAAPRSRRQLCCGCSTLPRCAI